MGSSPIRAAWQVSSDGRAYAFGSVDDTIKSKSLSSRMKKSVLIPQGKNEEC